MDEKRSGSVAQGAAGNIGVRGDRRRQCGRPDGQFVNAYNVLPECNLFFFHRVLTEQPPPRPTPSPRA